MRRFAAVLIAASSVFLSSCSFTDTYFDHLAQGEPFVTVSQDASESGEAVEGQEGAGAVSYTHLRAHET